MRIMIRLVYINIGTSISFPIMSDIPAYFVKSMSFAGPINICAKSKRMEKNV